MHLKLLAAVAAMALGGTAFGAEAPAVADTPALYSHAIPLLVSGKNAVVKVQLPQAAYLHARSTSLDDLRIFDAQGRKLPFTLIEPGAQTQTQHQTLPMKIFPVQKGAGQAGLTSADVDIRTSTDGSVVSVNAKLGRSQAAAPAELEALVLETGSSAPPQFDGMRFTLPAGTGNYSAQVEIEGSDDLKTWRLVANSALSWLADKDSGTLTNDRIAFAPTSFRYARVRWMAGTPLRFSAIVADVPAHTHIAPRTETLVLDAVPGKFANDLVYRAAPAIGVERLGLEFGAQDTVLPVAIGTYVELPNRKAGSGTSWEFRPIAQSTFFQLTQAGKTRRSGDIALNGTHAAEWVIRPQAEALAKPRLRLGWTPAVAVFLANGQPPYRLVVGRDKAPRAQAGLAQVAPGFSDQEIAALELAGTGAVQAQGTLGAAGPSAAAQAGASAQQRVAILWGVLLLGVAVLGYMAWRLVGQMRKP